MPRTGIFKPNESKEERLNNLLDQIRSIPNTTIVKGQPGEQANNCSQLSDIEWVEYSEEASFYPSHANAEDSIEVIRQLSAQGEKILVWHEETQGFFKVMVFTVEEIPQKPIPENTLAELMSLGYDTGKAIVQLLSGEQTQEKVVIRNIRDIRDQIEQTLEEMHLHPAEVEHFPVILNGTTRECIAAIAEDDVLNEMFQQSIEISRLNRS